MKFSVRKSLVARLVSTYLVLSLLVIACVGAASWLAGRELLRDAAFERLETISRQKEVALGFWVDERLRDIRFMSGLAGRLPGSQGKRPGAGPGGPEILALFKDFKSSQEDVLEVLLLAPTGGRVLASTEQASVGGYRASYNFYLQGRQGLAVQSVYPSPESLRPVLTDARR